MKASEMNIGRAYTDGETIGIYTSNCDIKVVGLTTIVQLLVAYNPENSLPVYEAFQVGTLSLVRN